MKRIICFDTSIATSNMGDYIIAESCNKELEPILRDNFVLRFPTHTPISHFYQEYKKFSGGRYRDYADYKFLYGTNLLNANMFWPTPTWNINVFNNRMAKGVICVGVGMGSNSIKPNFYTKYLLQKTLNVEYIHSTRDEKTANFLRELGFKAINTGCATVWGLDELHCKNISTCKADDVVFTLTDYSRDVEKDKELVKILKKNYKKIYFWVQGIDDLNYLNSLDVSDGIIIIPPSLEAYEAVLEKNVDYIGTRLHGGIKAMQKLKRAIIIVVDNRAYDMKKDINIHTINRQLITEELPIIINQKIATEVGIKLENIKKWKEQFNEF